MSRCLALVIAAVVGLGCGKVNSSDEGGMDAPPAEPDAGPAATCSQDGATCADGSTCFEGACGGAKVVAISSQCAVRASGSVWCWGSNEFGMSGEPSKSPTCNAKPCTPAPVKIESLGDVVAVTDDSGSQAGGSACALRKDRTVWCWGYNDDGRLGHDPASDRMCGNKHCNWTPQKVATLENVDSVVTNFGTTCAVTAGTVYCWGRNDVGQLGRGSPSAETFVPSAVSGLTGVTQIDMGKWEVCARTGSGQIWCWGWSGQWGSLGRLSSSDPVCLAATPTASEERCGATPARIATAGGGDLDDVLEVAVGDVHTCVLRKGGGVWCWGHGGYCQLGAGNNDGTEHPAPISMAGFPPAVELETKQHTCVKTSNGEVWCLGLNFLGQLGVGNLEGGTTSSTGIVACSLTPNKVPLLGSAASLVLRDHHSTVLATDGTVTTWGLNNEAQLGHPPTTTGDIPCAPGGTLSCNPNPKPVALP